jgi:hypothetical protein
MFNKKYGTQFFCDTSPKPGKGGWVAIITPGDDSPEHELMMIWKENEFPSTKTPTSVLRLITIDEDKQIKMHLEVAGKTPRELAMELRLSTRSRHNLASDAIAWLIRIGILDRDGQRGSCYRSGRPAPGRETSDLEWRIRQTAHRRALATEIYNRYIRQTDK